jgi:putative tryptophan/tyrosine transport system substrate-binding protein
VRTWCSNIARPIIKQIACQRWRLNWFVLGLLREVVPPLRRVAFMGNTDNSFVLQEMQEVHAAADALGLDCVTLEIRRAQDIAPAFDALGQRAQGLYLAGESLTDANRLRIIILALGARLPTTWSGNELAEAH